ncbi:unnamed protein product [Linum trigynum]|uniref:Uncharacterized protein n=1 Tax=Linum trigynum TaxID=586398 RepID=A0AAV2GY57_9ROSI
MLESSKRSTIEPLPTTRVIGSNWFMTIYNTRGPSLELGFLFLTVSSCSFCRSLGFVQFELEDKPDLKGRRDPLWINLKKKR